MRLIRNISGEPLPLIMHPRLRLLRLTHLHIRRFSHKMTGRSCQLPNYYRGKKTPEQEEALRTWCKDFIKLMSGLEPGQRVVVAPPSPEQLAQYQSSADAASEDAAPS